MGKPGNKQQSSMSNIFKRVPNYNYEKQSSEAIVPNIGGMGEQSSENVYMSDAEKSPLQQAGFSPLRMGPYSPLNNPDPLGQMAAAESLGGRVKHTGAPTGALGSDLRKQQYDDLGWSYDDTISGDHEGSFQPQVDPATANVEEPAVAPVDEAPVEEVPADPTVDPNPAETPAPTGREGRIANLEQKISDTIGDQEDGTTSDAGQRKARRLKNRVGRMKQRQANKERRQARRERVKAARQEPVDKVAAEGPGEVPVEEAAPETAIAMRSPITQRVQRYRAGYKS